MSKLTASTLATEEPPGLYASRVRVYPKAVKGLDRRIKWGVLILCLAIYYLLPWLRLDRGPYLPHQAVLMSIWTERFYFFGLKFWPQDIWFLAGLLIMSALSLFLVTSLVGRVWCGYACPQTVWTDLFMWVERLIEGDRNARMKRDQGPNTVDKIWRKLAKHAVWLGIAFWTGGAWIMYFVDAPTVTREFWTGTASAPVYAFTGIFTATTYTLAGWAREQVCTYMCPWPRFQSAMLDEQSIIVTYEGWRGEPRGHGKRSAATATGLGDCVDCGACVHVCPTGIDIRDGLQLECIGCGLCIDACNDVMKKTGAKPWLITWDTLARQAAKAAGRELPVRIFRPRTFIYLGALAIAGTALVTSLVLRSNDALSVLHDRAPLFIRVSNGELRNAYTLKLINKSSEPVDYHISVADVAGAKLIQPDVDAALKSEVIVNVGPDSLGSYRVLVQAPKDGLVNGSQPVDFVMTNPISKRQTVYRSAFMGPAQ